MSRTGKTKRIKKKNILPEPKIPNNKKSKFPIPEKELEELREFKDKKLVLSFRFLDLKHEAFNLGGTCNKWGNDLFKMLKELSNITRKQFVVDLREHYRSHDHDWDKLDYKYNFTYEFLEQVECRQARISLSKGGIHGFIVGNRFYVVWLDPHHNLYPDDKHGGVTILKPPETCCSYRDKELHRLNEELKEYESMVGEMTKPENVI